jgi:hypothetical protein
LTSRVRKEIKKKASSRHIPALIIEVPGYRLHLQHEKVESALTNIVNGRPVTNRAALINPESLDYFGKILPQLQRIAQSGGNFVPCFYRCLTVCETPITLGRRQGPAQLDKLTPKLT